MEQISEDQATQTLKETIKAIVREFYIAIEQKDIQRLDKLVVEDVFVFGPAAEAVSIGRGQFFASLQNQFERVKGTILRIQSSDIQVGLFASEASAWFFDQIVIDIMREDEVIKRVPIRLTGLLVGDQDWHLASSFWSIPLRSNEYQYSLLQDGKIQAGLALEDHIPPEAQPLAQSLVKVMAQPHSMPELYATREDTFVIGSTADEVFLAAEGKNWVEQIVLLPLKFAVRGGIRCAVSPDGCTAWMATHIDLSGDLTVAYRFFYIWLHEQGEWKIVLSHDAVCVDPCNPSFEAP